MKINFDGNKLIVEVTSQFKKNLKKLNKQGKNLNKLKDVIKYLANNKELDKKYQNHSLVDDKYYKNCKIKNGNFYIAIFTSSDLSIFCC